MIAIIEDAHAATIVGDTVTPENGTIQEIGMTTVESAAILEIKIVAQGQALTQDDIIVGAGATAATDIAVAAVAIAVTARVTAISHISPLGKSTRVRSSRSWTSASL